jgi:2-C-methyl-D-erythritol 4-phosphate cytidylyltransferase
MKSRDEIAALFFAPAPRLCQQLIMRVSAIVVAAGSGARLGASVPKAFVRVGGITLLARTLRTLGSFAAIDEIVITVPAGMESSARAEADTVGISVPLKTVVGGAERQDSVRIALGLTSAAAELILIHDAARPFATVTMFESCLARAAAVGAAIVAIPLGDTLKRVDQEEIRETVPRAGLWQAQTPQAFRRRLLIRAHEAAVRQKITATDDADLVERIGAPVAVVSGSPLNLKITTANDLSLAEAIAASRFPR